MIVAINQPAYLPWLGYFDRIDYVDKYIVLDHVQFEKNSFANRNKILSNNGSIWLTVPVQSKGRFGDLAINTILTDNKTKWAKKHLTSIQQNYSKSPFFEKYFRELEKIYTQNWHKLIDITETLNQFFLASLHIKTEILYSSSLQIQSTKSDLVLDLCEKVGATTYISGKLGRDYLEMDKFQAKNIKVLFQEYQHPKYPQRFEGFEPYMSILDLLFNCGDESIEIIRKGRNFVL